MASDQPGSCPGQQGVGLASGGLVRGGGNQTSHPRLVRNGHQEDVQRLLEILLTPPDFPYPPWENVEQSWSIDGEELDGLPG